MRPGLLGPGPNEPGPHAEADSVERSKKIKNYEFGLLPPTFNAGLVDDQMRLGHRYRNKLVEIERDRRAKISAALVGHPDVSALAARVTDLAGKRDAARLAIKAARAATRSRSETAAMREAAKALGAELKEARAILKAAKQAIAQDAQVAAQIKAVDAAMAQAVRDAREACGTYWSTYLLAEQAMDASRKAPAPPRFLRWTGDGRVSVQLQGGLDLKDAWGADTQLRIDPVSPDAYDPSKPRGIRRRAQRTILHMRVQSTDKGRPIWAEWPLILHRPIPPGARIKVATAGTGASYSRSIS